MAKYSEKEHDKVHKALHEEKEGTLKSKRQRQKSNQQKAGSSYRAFRSAKRRCQSAEEEKLINGLWYRLIEVFITVFNEPVLATTTGFLINKLKLKIEQVFLYFKITFGNAQNIHFHSFVEILQSLVIVSWFKIISMFNSEIIL